MSNNTVGQVYETIIKEVLEASKQDFDESGFEEGILEELKQGWQKRLSQLAIANFPWDPKPETVPVNNAPAPSLPEQVMPAASYTQAQLSPPSDAQHISLSHVPLPPIAQSLHSNHIKPDPAGGEPIIKQEPGMHNSSMPGPHPVFAPSLPGGQAGGGVAQQRAIQHMQATFGPRASGSINAINQGQIGHPGSAQGQGTPNQRPSGPQAVQQQQLYRAQLAAQMQQQQQQHNQQQRPQHPTGVHAPNGVGNSQVDGADESFEGVLMQRSADGNQVELGRVEIDSMLHEQIAARAKQMEGGGLMLPLKQATKHRSVAVERSHAGISQGDAADDEIKEEIADDDAINSDLDDPDDDQDEDEEDDETNPLMLCMYDKVQRVKNKWKCTLKDGVLTVNGKDYVFHKATGEYEW